MILWREKFVATGIHFLVTAASSACAAALVFLAWYPDPFQTMIGGTKLFILVTTCGLALGPLISLVVYNSRKSRRALLFDYVVVGTVQIAALVYGVYLLAGARPVYVAFSLDRIEIVSARDISPAERAAARNPLYRSFPIAGPRLVAVVIPLEEHNDALFEAMNGNEEHLRPRFYVPYESELANIRTRAKPLAELESAHPESKPLVDKVIATLRIPESRMRWLPARHRKGFWTALIDLEDGKPKSYIPVDPY
jgi:hypothetical protein